MKVLFLHSNQPDYVADGLFHGLRSLLGRDCVDVPRYDSMYRPVSDRIKSKLRGGGFTLYGLLEDDPLLSEDRFFWEKEADRYDIIVIANIYRQWLQFHGLAKKFSAKKLILVDGEDTQSLFPFASHQWWSKQPQTLLNPATLSRVLGDSKYKYFKRELVGGGSQYGFDRKSRLPSFFKSWIKLPKNVFHLSCSIPKEKINVNPTKSKDFVHHIVDKEVAEKIKGSYYSKVMQEKLFFNNEAEYVADLSKSKFGVTMFRICWDSLRTYEFAANGCVPCFKNLNKKPRLAGPVGLNSSNSISYKSHEDLMGQITSLSEKKYLELQKNSYEWIENNTTEAKAKYFLEKSV